MQYSTLRIRLVIPNFGGMEIQGTDNLAALDEWMSDEEPCMQAEEKDYTPIREA